MGARDQHHSPAFLADAVNKLDSVFGDLSGAAERICVPGAFPPYLVLPTKTL
jgi:hypothetical protein